MQIRANVVDSNVLIVEAGRATGKTEGVMGPRIIRVANDMPGELSFLVHKTYVALMTNVIFRHIFPSRWAMGGVLCLNMVLITSWGKRKYLPISESLDIRLLIQNIAFCFVMAIICKW